MTDQDVGQDVGIAFATLATALAVALHKQGVADGEALLAETIGTLEAVLRDDDPEHAQYPEHAKAILAACARSLRAAEG
ncbi:hypothetical protein [Methylobacterium sp. 17Sr1-1]|uniref:hypothetical protein n=1 Tax=Methylobacterium sp. 17Sr1-1 TaxID=2202826 RepID=UPI000D6EDCF6|nr:hypothetical protein [Methylobacterium sp. 17Sr1-1]AWN54447.1 hypothetical protein DK412_24855 [Methylobacterium sp. 17Sr1-1]